MNAAFSSAEVLREHQREALRLTRHGVLVLLFGLLPVVLWATLAPLSSAVVASAVVKVDQHRRPVQHVEGGIVREVRVRDGQQVLEGETLIVLGDVAVDADMQRWDARVTSERVSLARLEAEQSLATSITFQREVLHHASADAGLAQLLTKEQSLFGARRSALTSQVSLLRIQREKVTQEVRALNAQIKQAVESLKLQNDELFQ